MSPLLSLAWLLTKAAGFLDGMLASGASALGSVLFTQLGKVLTQGPHGAERAPAALTLQRDPQPALAVTVQRSLAADFQAVPAYYQEADAALRAARPTEWTWTEQVAPTAPADYDWATHFSESLRVVSATKAAALQRKYGLSDQQTEYEATSHCPLDKQLTTVTYYRSAGPPGFALPVQTSSLLWGPDLDLYGTTLRRGDFVTCLRGHRWWVYAADAGHSAS